MARRKAGTLLPLEVIILSIGVDGSRKGHDEFHGFALAERLSKGDDAVIGYGALYKALDRMERAGLLSSRWEDPKIAAAAARPKRRLYKVTAAGAKALAQARAVDPLLRQLRGLLSEA